LVRFYRVLIYAEPRLLSTHHTLKFFLSISAEGVQPMAWVIRVNIAISVARGLTFLHSLDQNVIFRDLKASNILLDSVCDIKTLVCHSVMTTHSGLQQVSILKE